MKFFWLKKLNEFSFFQKSQICIIAFFLILYRLPTVFGEPFDFLLRILVLLIWIITIITNVLTIKRGKVVNFIRKNILYIIGIVYFIIPIIYSLFNYNVSYLEIFSKVGYILIGTTLFLIFAKSNKTEISLLIKIINFSIVSYLIINIALVYFTGFRDLGNNLLLSFFKIDFPRISYPLNKSVGQIGFLFIAAFIIELLAFKNRWFNYIKLIVLCIGIFILDSRNVYLSLLYLIIGYVFITYYYSKYKYYFLTFFTMTLVFTFPALSMFKNYFSEVDLISARNSLGRFDIWAMAIQEFKNSNLLNIFIGHGLEGYFFNGLSDKTIDILNMNLKKATAHNSLINNLYEVGIIGVGIIGYILMCTFQKIEKLLVDKTELKKELYMIYLVLIGSLFYGNLVSINIYTSVEIILLILFLIILILMMKS